MCVLCRRSLLTGERYRTWLADHRRERTVCALCEHEALLGGWRPAPGVSAFEPPLGLIRRVRKVA